MRRIQTLLDIKEPEKCTAWISRWNKPNDINILSYVSDVCSPVDFVAFSEILFPDFIVRENAIFLGLFLDESDIVKIDLTKKNKSLVEKSYNIINIWDLFSGNINDIEDRVYEDIGKIICLSWRMCLESKFPDRKFIVKYENSEQNYGPIVYFYQDPSWLNVDEAVLSR